MVKDTQTGDCFRADHLIEGKKNKSITFFIKLFVIYWKDYLEKLLETKDITDEKKAEIKRILPQVDLVYQGIRIQWIILFRLVIWMQKACGNL